ncbi:transposase [Denitratimonas sp. CY0512]|uniref:REP-associated tyrosine transposase n=1 Tax=Denitratimonas sp. CY0512 TaxID=3131940 RepID=UPI001690A8A6|nr:transposase [Gammaproteobacteria bacterium]
MTVITPAPSGHGALRRGRYSEPGRVYHLTSGTHDRRSVFSDHRAAWAACRSFHDSRLLRDTRLLAWVLMPDHAHWLLELGVACPLPKVVELLKSASARHANRALGRCGPLWARAYHDRALRYEDDVIQTARYILGNPLRAGLVQRIGDYPYWNAIWL